MTSFFKKITPQVKLQLSTGLNLTFDNVDGVWGVLKTTNPEIVAQLKAAERSEIGGVSEITEAEYNEMVQKKTTSGPLWREEFSKSAMRSHRPTDPPKPLPDAVASGERFPEPVRQQPGQPIVTQPTPVYKPTATPRK